VDEIGKRVGGRLGPSSAQSSKARQHGLRLGKIDVSDFSAVATVPAKRRPFESGRFRLEQEQEQLERVGEPDVLQVRGGGERDHGVPGVERATEARVGRTLRCHEHMFARVAVASCWTGRHGKQEKSGPSRQVVPVQSRIAPAALCYPIPSWRRPVRSLVVPSAWMVIVPMTSGVPGRG
jgi:hypothetical protein